MTKISIEIPLTWGSHLAELLEAIRTQTYQEYEITVASSLGDGSYSDMLQEHGAKVVHCGPYILEKRYSAHKLSMSDYSLLLDETRIPQRDLLFKLATRKEDMVVIGEKDIGRTFWVRMSNLDKINSIECNSFDMKSGYVLPRYFRAEILDRAFASIRKKISDRVFKSVLMEDHQLISYEACQLSKSFAKINEELISHYGDQTLYSIIRKYHRYGKYHNVLKNTYYGPLLSPKNRVRKVCIGSVIQLYVFYAARGIPFMVGYYLF